MVVDRRGGRSGGEGRWGVVEREGGVVERGGSGRERRERTWGGVPPLFHGVDETRKIPDTLQADSALHRKTRNPEHIRVEGRKEKSPPFRIGAAKTTRGRVFTLFLGEVSRAVQFFFPHAVGESSPQVVEWSRFRCLLLLPPPATTSRRARGSRCTRHNVPRCAKAHPPQKRR